ncbi:hypothetical protein [Pedobacter faecalis]|uniref:hypothetical protein n=1 Tax=Pedobacter faecalis TaxID=3041495 RepID=UPI00254E296C|nr:hypothetical protein [Pedobacter sp. ELA7]
MTETNTLCPVCNTAYQETYYTCNNCEYPLQGSQQEKDHFISEREVKHIELADLGGKVTSAKRSLFFVAGIEAVFGAIAYFSAKSDADKFSILLGEIAIIGIFALLGFWAKRKPKAALITGLSTFVALHLLSALANPVSLFSGVIYKVVVIVYLLNGIRSVSKADALKKELNMA